MARYPVIRKNSAGLERALASLPGWRKLSDLKFVRDGSDCTIAREDHSNACLAVPGRRLCDTVLIDGDSQFDIEAWRHPDAALERSFSAFARLVTSVLDHRHPDAHIRDVINLGLGLSGSGSLPHRPLLSNLRVRRRAYQLLFEHLSREWDGPPGTRRRWYFGTLITDMGNTLEYAPVIEMGRLRRDFRKAVAKTGLNTVAFIEIQAGTNYPQQGHGRTLACHAHFTGFTDDPEFDMRRANTLACSGSTLSNWLGAPTAKIAAIPSVSELKRRCYYLLKAPVKGHYLDRSELARSGYKTQHADVPSLVALRLAEALAQLDYTQATFTTGTGTIIKGEWLRELAAWQRPLIHSSDTDCASALADVWSCGNTKVARNLVDVRWTAKQLLCPRWSSAMSELLPVP